MIINDNTLSKKPDNNENIKELKVWQKLPKMKDFLPVRRSQGDKRGKFSNENLKPKFCQEQRVSRKINKSQKRIEYTAPDLNQLYKGVAGVNETQSESDQT